ncbi:nose resistant to fluoxetine protein 6 [Strongylocentrotus purpuratus]|uniref:Nose resistant-to-fluoxetine protein N-terminal domain-containing protein n=1 Tax=Strongylocentrotus purpuratus TaxID=7668 RepID=A0A7M7SZ03_STRPU|nr:nose resistant to fluoxetine protein 6 [Strongylocentrotus purpuratus]
MGMFIILSIACCLSSAAQASLENDDIVPSSIMMSFWDDWIRENILPPIRVGEASSNGSQCFQELEKIFTEGGKKRNIIVDATGKPSSGILEGNIAWLGDYRQCVDTTDLHYCLTTAQIRVQSVSHRQSGSLSVGVCLPEECREKDIFFFSRFIKNLVPGDLIGRVKVNCNERMNPSGDSGFICTMVVVSLLCLLCLSATAYESYQNHRNSLDEERQPILEVKTSKRTCSINESVNDKDLSAWTWRRCILCFSLTRSVNQITNTTSGKDDIQCLHGMRVISMFWIILGHSLSFQQKSGALADVLWVYSFPAKWFTSQVIFNSYVALDTFFFLGGLLVAYTGFKYMSKSVGRVNWLVAIVHRYIRITPAMAVVILLYTFVYPYLGEGPFWYQRVEDVRGCYQWWWTNFLYINNFVPSDTSSGCLSWSWYLATDMQLFLLAIILIVLLWWHPAIGIVSLAVLSLASITVRAVIFSERGYAATQPINSATDSTDMFPFSVKPYACATAYLVGIAAGYCLHVLKNKALPRLHVVVVILGWLSAFAMGMSIVYGLYGAFDHPGPKIVVQEKPLNVAYGCLKSLAWTLALSWVVFTCHYGYGGVINRFLSWSFWIPLSRLTFCAYLLHPAIIYLNTGTISMSYNFNVIGQSFRFTGFVTISYSAAFILSSLIEMPISSLQKMFLKR